MKFSEAMAAMEDGSKVHPVTGDPEHYLYLNADREICSPSGRPIRFSSLAASVEWELYEASGHDWTWAKEQLRAGKTVKRKKNLDTYKLDSWGCVLTAGESNQDEPAYHFIDDDDAMDWVLA